MSKKGLKHNVANYVGDAMDNYKTDPTGFVVTAAAGAVVANHVYKHVAKPILSIASPIVWPLVAIGWIWLGWGYVLSKIFGNNFISYTLATVPYGVFFYLCYLGLTPNIILANMLIAGVGFFGGIAWISYQIKKLWHGEPEVIDPLKPTWDADRGCYYQYNPKTRKYHYFTMYPDGSRYEWYTRDMPF